MALSTINKPVNELLPHGRQALVIDEIHRIDEENVSGEVVCKLVQDSPFWAKDGSFRSIWLVEAMAQAVAAVFGYSDKIGGGASLGYLIAIDEFSFSNEVLVEFDDIVKLNVRLDHDLDPVGVWSVEAKLADQLMCAGRFKCVVDREGSLFNQ